VFFFLFFLLSCDFRNFSFGDVHVEGARVVAEACAQCGVEQLIHFSALQADPESPSKFLQSKVRIRQRENGRRALEAHSHPSYDHFGSRTCKMWKDSGLVLVGSVTCLFRSTLCPLFWLFS